MGACCDAGTDLRPANNSGGIARGAGNDSKPVDERVKVTYFPSCYGRPDVIVMLLEHKGVDYVRLSVSQEEWATKKTAGESGEMGGLPMVDVNDGV